MLNQEVDVVRFSVELQQLKAALLSDTDADGVHPCQVSVLQDSFAVLGLTLFPADAGNSFPAPRKTAVTPHQPEKVQPVFSG